MDDPEFRESLLRQGPIGHWRSSMGSAAVVLGDDLFFAADHTGWLRRYSTLSGVETLRFQWEMESRAKIQIKVEWEDEDDTWEFVEMEFRTYETDVGGVHTVLAEPGQDDFWLAAGPLKWTGTPR